MSDAINKLVMAMLEGFRAALRADPTLRAAIRDTLKDLLRELDTTDPTAVANVALVSQPPAEAGGSPIHPSGSGASIESVALPVKDMVLRLGDTEASVRAVTPSKSVEASGLPIGMMGPQVVSEPPAQTTVPPRSTDLRECARRCRIKAAGCRWAVERRRLLAASDDDPDAVTARDRDLFAQAKTFVDCYLWMMDPHGPSLPDDAHLETLAGCYDTAADAAELVLLVDAAAEPAGDAAQDALRLLAETLSALRFGLSKVDRNLEDHDQRELFLWLRDQTARRHVYVARHMRLDDPADPEKWLSRVEDVARVRQSLEKRRQSEDERRKLLNRARYHAKKARDAMSPADAEDNWKRLAGAVEQIVGGGVPPSDREIRELLLPLLDDLPELDFGPNMRAVLDEADRYLERLEQEQEREQDTASRKLSATVEAARQLLAGRVAVLVGGYPREPQRRKLEEALGLAELRWVSVLHHQSLDDELLSQCRRAETSVFLAMTRFRSHQFGPQTRSWCKQFAKVYVELPGGYGVEQVAHQVMEQASGQLNTSASLAASPGTTNLVS
jgi:hypothetical protein